MSRLMLVILVMASVTMAGIAIVIALTLGLDTTRPIVTAAAIGFVLSVPVSWFVARQIEG